MSDRRERLNSPTTSLLVALDGFQSTLWTTLPVKVASVARLVSENTVDLQPTIMGKYLAPGAQAYTNIKLPRLLQCPVHFGAGSAFVLTFPLAVGDEGLVILAARCIDAWFATGADDNVQSEMRMHDLSDGFFLPGFRSKPNIVPSISMTDVQLRNFAGDTYVSISPSKDVNVVTPASINAQAGVAINLTAPLTKITGNLQVTGNATVDTNLQVNGNTVMYGTVFNNVTNIGNSHKHSGVQSGSSDTGYPI